MIDLKELQKEIYQNKVNKGFDVTDINKEFCFLYGEVSESYEAWRKKKVDLVEEKNKLEWVVINKELLNNDKFAGHYNVPHIISQIKTYLKNGTDIDKY